MWTIKFTYNIDICICYFFLGIYLQNYQLEHSGDNDMVHILNKVQQIGMYEYFQLQKLIEVNEQ